MAAIVAVFFGLLAAMPRSAQAAEGFTGEKFVGWPRKNQDSLIQTSITMIGIVATQGHSNIARCIDEWYAGDDVDEIQRHDLIINAIDKNASHHPQAVILAIIQKQCGSFKDSVHQD